MSEQVRRTVREKRGGRGKRKGVGPFEAQAVLYVCNCVHVSYQFGSNRAKKEKN